MTDNIDFDDENIDGLEYIEEEVDVSAFVVEEIQESRQQLATLIREFKNTENESGGIEVVSNDTSNKVQVVNNNTPINTITMAHPATIEDDFNFVRQNMIKMAKDGMIIMDDLIDIARSSQHPQMFRELTNTLKELAVINKDILEIHKTKAEIEFSQNNGNTPSVQNNTQTNNYFGTTEELIAIIAKQNANKSGDQG